MDDLSSKDSHKDADSCHRMNRETSRDPSIDSALSSVDGGGGGNSSTTTTGGHLQRFSTNSGSTTSCTTGDDENVAVKYSLRNQNIDYIPSRKAAAQQQQRNVVTCISPSNSSIRNGSEGEYGRRGSDLQRQKPIVMRSISGGGGYEAPKSCSTAGLQRAATTMATMDTSGSGNNNNNNEEDARKAKSPGHDDEPIMV